MRDFIWHLIVRIFDREFTAACLAAEDAGYSAGYEAAHIPDEAFREEFAKGYEAARYDIGAGIESQ